MTPHGQGETCLLFRQPGAVVLELDPYLSERFALFASCIAQVSSLRLYNAGAPTRKNGAWMVDDLDRGNLSDRVRVDLAHVVGVVDDLLRKQELFRAACMAQALDALRGPTQLPVYWPAAED